MPYDIIASAGTAAYGRDDFKGMDTAIQKATGSKGNIQYLNGPGADGNIMDTVTGNLKGQSDHIYAAAEKSLSKMSDKPLILVGHSRSGESTRIAAGRLEEKYPDANIKVILLDPVRGTPGGLAADHYASPSKYPTTVMWSGKENTPLYSKSNVKDSPNIKQITLDIEHSGGIPGNAKGSLAAKQAFYDQLLEDIQGKKDMPINPVVPTQENQDNVVPEGFDPKVWAEANPVNTPSQIGSNSVPEGFDPKVWAEANPTVDSPVTAKEIDKVKTIPDQSFLNSVGGNIQAFAKSVNNSFEQLKRGITKGEMQIAGAIGAGNWDQEMANIDMLSQSAARQQEQTSAANPISSAIGGATANAFQVAPMMAATGGLGSLGLAGNVAQGAATQGALGYAADTSGDRLSAGALGAAGGAAGGVLGSATGYAAAKIGNRIGGILSPKGKEAAEVFKQTGVKPTIASQSSLPIRKAFEVTSDLPLSGTQEAADKIVGGVQQSVKKQLASYADDFQKDFGDDLTKVMQTSADKSGGNSFQADRIMQGLSKDNEWAKQVADSGKLNYYYQQAAYNSAKKDLLTEAGLDNPVSVKQLHDVIDKVIGTATNPVSGGVKAQYSPAVITQLGRLRDDIGALAKTDGKISVSDLDDTQGIISGMLNDMYKPSKGFGDADTHLVNGIKKAFDEVEETTIKNVKPELYAKLRDMKSNKFKSLEMMKSNLFAKLINDTANPDDAAMFLFQRSLNSKNTAQHFFNALDPVGRSAVKYGYAKRVYEGIQNVAEDSPGNTTAQIAAMTSPKMKNMLRQNGDFTHTFFAPAEIQEINGALKAAHYLDNYAATFSKSPTGRINSMGGKMAAAAASGVAAPISTGAALAGVTIFNKLMNSSAGPWLQAASKIQPDSPAYASLMEKIVKSASISAGGEAVTP